MQRFKIAILAILALSPIFATKPALAQNAESARTIVIENTSSDLVVPKGTTAIFDTSVGPLKVRGRLENHGTITLKGSKEHAVIEAESFLNEGSIISEADNLIIQAPPKTGFAPVLTGGSLTAAKTISFISDTDIVLTGGDITAERVIFTANKKVQVYANRIDGKIEITSDLIGVAVANGNLNITRQETSGDPVYYNFGGDVSVPSFSHSGGITVDFVAIASGNVTTGDISTNGAVLLGAGVNFHFRSTTLPTTGSGGFLDSDCWLQALMNCVAATSVDSFGGYAELKSGTITSNGQVSLHSGGTIEVSGPVTSIDEVVNTHSIAGTTINGKVEGQLGASLRTEGTNGFIVVNGDLIGKSVGAVAGLNLTTGVWGTAATVKIYGDAKAHNSTSYAAVTLQAGSTIQVENVEAFSTSERGQIWLNANRAGGSGELDIGGAGGVNSATSLKASTDTGGVDGYATTSEPGIWTHAGHGQFIYVSNGGTSGITIEDGSAISTVATASPNGAILIDATSGNLKIKDGILSSLGSGTHGGGQIVLRAQQVNLTNGVEIDTSSTNGGTNHYVLIAARQFFFSGGATIRANGAAGPVIPTGFILNTPEGTLIEDGILPHWSQTDQNNASVQVYSSDGSNLNVYTYGENNGSFIAANPLSFFVGQANFLAYGLNTSHTIHYPGTASGTTSLSFDYGAVNFYADSDGSAEGNKIKIEADNVTSNTSATVGLFSRAFGTGAGGTITVTAENVLLSEASNYFDASALTEGDGGNISITTKNMELPGTYLTADALGSGTGGEIKLGLSDENSALDTATLGGIYARGGANGYGGTLEITDIVPTLDLLVNIDVYTAEGTPAIAQTSQPFAGTTGSGGILKFQKRGANCWFHNAADRTRFPKGYWNCTHQGSETAEDRAAIDVALTLSNTDKATLKHVSIWVWNDFEHWRKAKAPTETNTGQAGISYAVSATDYQINVFQSITNYPNMNVNQISETAGHELGHANDDLLAHSNRGDYGVFFDHDYQTLDYDEIHSTAATSHLRAPCTTGRDGKPGPLVGVVDQVTGAQFCNSSGNLVSSQWLDASNSNKPYRNSYIVRTSAPYIFTTKKELYSQQFAWVSFVYSLANPADYFIYTFDGIIRQGQFECTKSWANAVKNGTARPPTTPAGCSTVESWYASKLGQKSSHD